MFRRTALAVAAGAVALSGAALLSPGPADAAGDVVASADSARQKLLTPEQRQELRTTGHLTVTKDTKKHGVVTVLVQRGEVTAVSATSISLKSKDGFTHAYVITEKTKVREKRQLVKLSDVKVGERAMVIAVHTDKGDVARRIGCLQGRAG